MDNFNLKFTGESRVDFNAVIGMAVRHAPGSKVEAYSLVNTPDGPTLVFLWLKQEGKNDYTWTIREKKYLSGAFEGIQGQKFEDMKLPIPKGTVVQVSVEESQSSMAPILSTPFRTAEAASDFAWHWLQEVAEYGPEPDHEGDNHKGFYLFTGFWGHVLGNSNGIIGIRPCWAMYGK